MVLPAPQLAPELAISTGFHIARIAEYPVVFAGDFIEFVVKNVEEVCIGRYDSAIEIKFDNCLHPVQGLVDGHQLTRLHRRLHETGTRGVILDLSGVETLDSHEFGALRLIINMIEIMGAQCVLTGMKPGVVSALIEVGADVDGLRTAIDLDAAFILLEPEPEPEWQLDALGEGGQDVNLSDGDDLMDSTVAPTNGLEL